MLNIFEVLLSLSKSHDLLGIFLIIRPQYSADWGDYISFASHLRRRADEEGADLLLIDTGDRVEGNGLYDSSDPQGLYTYDIFRQQTIDLICTGNHELYVYETAAREHKKTVPYFRDNYIASNIYYIDPETGEQTPMAQKYKRFRTKNQSIEVVAFGFIFDFTGNANNTVVQPVEEAVQEEWFKAATNPQNQPDLFVVIGHVGVRMEEFRVIYRAIRQRNFFTPIAFFGGHRHVRDSTSYDSRAFALASGRYFETVGFMSIDGIIPRLPGDASSTHHEQKITFHRRYLDNNLWGFHYHTGLNDTTFPTELGRKVSATIATAREELKLDHIYGCAPRNLWMTRRPVDDENSIYHWITHSVLPDMVVNEGRKEKARLIIMNTGAIRFDIFEGAFTVDSTYIVSPFKSRMKFIPDVPYTVAKKVLGLLNLGGPIFQMMEKDHGINRYDEARNPKRMGIPQQWDTFEERIGLTREEQIPNYMIQGTENFEINQQYPLLPESKSGKGDGDHETKPMLIGGYTTRDDVSEDGDDTIHKPLNFYAVPNCIQAEVNMLSQKSTKEKDRTGDFAKALVVDLVYVDFVEPWIFLALNVASGRQTKYKKSDAHYYMDGTFTEAMVRWIEANWAKKC